MNQSICVPLVAALAPIVSCSQPAPTPTPTPTPTPAAAAAGLDDFEDVTRWQVVTSDGVEASIHPVPGVDGQAMRLDFDFRGHGGYAAIRRPVALEMPEDYQFSFQMRADSPDNTFEFKLVDASGDNVWGHFRRDYTFPRTWEPVTIKKRHIRFAWGPTKDRTLERAAALELVVAAGRGGGRGSVYFDQLTFRERAVAAGPPPRPVATASVSAPGSQPGLAVDGAADTAWNSGPAAGVAPVLTLDLGRLREFGGLILHWGEGGHARVYDVELSGDGASWRRVRAVTEGNGGRDPLLLTESEARYVRLTLRGGPGPSVEGGGSASRSIEGGGPAVRSYALAEVEIADLEFGASANAFIGAVAKKSPRGHFPRGFWGEQSYWTLVGTDGGNDSALLSEDGVLEFGRGKPSIEPFVVSGSQVTSWAEVETSHSLNAGYVPIPDVVWRDPRWKLTVTAIGAGSAEQSQALARYSIENLTGAAIDLQLVLAIRPFQVNAPTQFLSTPGGVSPIHSLRWDGTAVAVNGEPVVYPLSPADHVGVYSFDAGGFPDAPAPATGAGPAAIEDPTGFASGALVYDLHLAPRATATVGVAVPLTGTPRPPALAGEPVRAWLDGQEKAVAAAWRAKLDRVSLNVPAAGQPIVDTVRTALAHILMSRDGPILRPGTRSYARSWIRDGAMISEGLLRLGHEALAIDYLRWYAPHQFESGKVPCCVDHRGADPVPENDSHGELIYLAAEIHRFTRDRAVLEFAWPYVEGAARYLEKLRQSERTAANQTPERRAYYGLLPPSISHEGYSDKPAYSYWDDFWGLKGYEDAQLIAEVLGKREAAERIARQGAEFREDLYASIAASTQLHGIDFIPGAADRGDFDATSTTIALAPGGEQQNVPPTLLTNTFERYWNKFVARRGGVKEGPGYTPYELRVVSTFVRLGWRARVSELFAFFLADRRPAAWNQWGEVVHHEPRKARFLGDMPHAWIASDYIRAALDTFAYEREADQTLVLAAGIPVAWFDAPGVAVTRLRTRYGVLDYSIARARGRVTVQVSGSVKPPGGLVFPWPWKTPPGRARVNGKPTRWRGGELVFDQVPATIVIQSR